MIIGVPKEIKNHEYRVGMIPASVREVISHGHQVFVETNAAQASVFQTMTILLQAHPFFLLLLTCLRKQK